MRRLRRFAWTTPMGTVLPLGERSYGEHLIWIALEPDAFFLHFTPEREPAFSAMDGSGREVPIAAVLANPSQIASVFHEQPSAVPMREFIVHGRVRAFAVDTPEIVARVRRDRDHLAAMLAWSRTHPGGDVSMTAHWSTRLDAAATPFAMFAACMPFDTPRHRPTPTALRNLARALGRNATRHARTPRRRLPPSANRIE